MCIIDLSFLKRGVFYRGVLYGYSYTQVNMLKTKSSLYILYEIYKEDNKKHKPKTHKKRSNRKSKKHVKKRGGNMFSGIVSSLTNKGKMSVEDGLEALKDIVINLKTTTTESNTKLDRIKNEFKKLEFRSWQFIPSSKSI